MKSFALIVVVAACSAQADDFPVQPAGGGQLPPSGTGSSAITGRACVVADARDLSRCEPVAGGLAVTGGGATTTTASDGSFTLDAALASDPTTPRMLSITGPGVVPTQIDAAGVNSVPVVKADLFSQMLVANGITLTPGSGSILGSVVRGTSPASGISVVSTPSPAFGPLFDGTTPTAWTLDATGARGVVWLPGVAVGPTQLTFRDLATSGETTVGGVQVIDGGITILDTVLP
jgi:hypothetical protein